jgi:hypothetical protein
LKKVGKPLLEASSLVGVMKGLFGGVEGELMQQISLWGKGAMPWVLILLYRAPVTA